MFAPYRSWCRQARVVEALGVEELNLEWRWSHGRALPKWMVSPNSITDNAGWSGFDGSRPTSSSANDRL